MTWTLTGQSVATNAVIYTTTGGSVGDGPWNIGVFFPTESTVYALTAHCTNIPSMIAQASVRVDVETSSGGAGASGGNGCPPGQSPGEYLFCLMNPDPFGDFTCADQTEFVVTSPPASCSYDAAAAWAQSRVTNWDLHDGACPPCQ